MLRSKLCALALALAIRCNGASATEVADLDDPALGQDLDTKGYECPSGHQLLWSLTATMNEMSKAVLQMRGQVAQLEHHVAGMLALQGDATMQIRAPNTELDNGTVIREERYLLALEVEAVKTSNLARGLEAQLLIAQGQASTAYHALSGDARLSANGTLDLGDGRVDLDEITPLGEGEIIIGGGVGASPQNNSKVRLRGDVRLERDGTVRILPNMLKLSQVERASVGQLIVGQGAEADVAYKTMIGDAELTAEGALFLRENVVDRLVLAPKAIYQEHFSDSAVREKHLGDASVSARAISAGAVSSVHLLDGTVATADLGDGSVTVEKLALSADGGASEGMLLVYNAQGKIEKTRMRHDASMMAGGVLTIQAGVVDTGKLADLAVTEPKLAASSVSERAIADGAVTYSKLRLDSGFPPFEKTGDAGAPATIMTVISGGRGAAMVGTEGRLLYKQYYSAAADEAAAAVDAGAVGVGAETNWNASASTQSAYVALHAVRGGSMEERARFGADVTKLGGQGSARAATHTLEVGGRATLSAACTSCGDGGGLKVENTATQSDGDLMHIAGRSGRTALRVGAGNVVLASRLEVGGVLSAPAMEPTVVSAAATAGGALRVRTSQAMASGTLMSVEGTTGQIALAVSAGEVEVDDSFSVNTGETYLGRKLGPGGVCQGATRSACPVMEVRASEVLSRRPVRLVEPLKLEAGLQLSTSGGSTLDASGLPSGLGLLLSVPAAEASAFSVARSGEAGSPLLRVDTVTGKVHAAAITATNIVAADGELDISTGGGGTGVLQVPAGGATGFALRSKVLGVATDHLTVNTATSVVTAPVAIATPRITAGLLRLGVVEVTAADSIVIPTATAAMVRVMPDADNAATSNFYALGSPGSDAPEGQMLIVSNHAANTMQHSDGTLPDVAAGGAAIFLYLGSSTWVKV